MKKLSLFQKFILGYKNISRVKNLRKPLTGIDESKIKETASSLKLSPSLIEDFLNKIKDIETKLSEKFDKSVIKLIENLEKKATDNEIYLLPQITESIGKIKEKANYLELAGKEEIDPVEEINKQVQELEREQKILEESKKKILEKYYNREIDEASVKNIIDDYERRLTELGIRIQTLKNEQGKAKNLVTESGKKRITPQEFFSFIKVPSEIKATISGQSKISLKIPITKTQTIQTRDSPQSFESTTSVSQVTTQPATTQVKEPEVTEGLELPKIPKYAKLGSLEAEEETTPLFLTYPLIPRYPARGEPIFAYAKIFWSNERNRYFYHVVEPQLSDKLREIYQRVKNMLEERLDVDFSKIKKIEAKKFLNEQIEDVLKFFNFVITTTEKKILKYYMERDFIGLGIIEPLMHDPNIEDISCDGVKIPIFIFHRDPKIGSVASNLTFNNSDELDSFIIRLAQISGKSISVANPLLDGTLPDGSRIQATLGTDIARKGSNFTIRKFTEDPLTPVHLLNYETLDVRILAYLWLVTDYGRNILVSGGTASGKTSLLNVLSLFIRPEKKIVSIEDTAELRLPHSHWVPFVARTEIGAEGKGEVDMFELLQESFRQRPDYIIVGEVRGKEAFILFQQMATGHPSLATIHAENMQRLMDRLTTQPISLPPALISTLDVIIFLARMKYRNKFVRKVTEIVEMMSFDPSRNIPITNQMCKWNPQTDKFDIANKSIALKKIADFTGISKKDIQNELQRRMIILEWMRENQILNYRDVHKIFSYYYANPERLLSTIQGAV